MGIAGIARRALATLILLIASPAPAEPFVPAADSEVLERLPAADAGGRELAARREALARNPQDLRLALPLAEHYVALGRSAADPRYDGYAQAALEPWWTLAEPPLPVLILRATLRQRRHDFTAALADLDQALARAPGDPQALLSKATIQGVQGRPGETLQTCRLLAGRVERLVEAACRAGARGLGGEARAAYALLERSLATARGADPAIASWARTIMAELAVQLGDPAAAVRDFRTALALAGREPYLLGAYADVLLDRPRPEEVLTLLAGETRIDPLLLRLALAEQQLGHPDLETHVALLAARFEAARRRGDQVHLREAAVFTLKLLQRPDEALALALADFAVQREPADLRIVLAAALAAGRPEAAAAALAWRERSGLEDVASDALARRLQEAGA
jgi:hypothetical protein